MKYLKRGLFFFALAIGFAFFMLPKESVDENTFNSLAFLVFMLLLIGLGTCNVAIAEQILNYERLNKPNGK